MATTILLPLILMSLFSTAVATTIAPSLQPRGATIIKEFLDSHNVVRAKHSLPLLVWNTRLANFAKWHANTRRGDCALTHSVGDLGENIFWGQGRRWKVSEAVGVWAVQEKYYDSRHNACMLNKECLHYTQMVWKSTKYVGCAKTKCNSGDTYVVCEYYPHGNVIGQRPY
ncbi:hypothetical protein OSB04_un001821 [Centaurea solstitialis]|uniref:SCP domain-containing protein n=1 Tax=Centaurea solstitialis TaxID=347529 RepID=A0AA38W4Q0_9ASTR|nr:hypothetical protein OSB04_un001821 [Centaurea solstitialis]